MMIKTKDGKEFKLCQWQREQWLQHGEFIISTASVCIHEVELDNGECFYLVPKEVLLFAKEGSDEMGEEDEQNE